MLYREALYVYNLKQLEFIYINCRLTFLTLCLYSCYLFIILFFFSLVVCFFWYFLCLLRGNFYGKIEF